MVWAIDELRGMAQCISAIPAAPCPACRPASTLSIWPCTRSCRAHSKYQWQLRHRWRPWLHFGAQGFGEVGPWRHWATRDEQSHRAGPALFGTLPVGEGNFSWQMAYLIGSTYARHGQMFTMRTKYDF
jgi:hypothetical protein